MDYSNLTKEQLIEKLLQMEKELKESKKYGLVWEEHTEGLNFNAIPILKELKEKSINLVNDKKSNLLLEGDNYYALKALQYTHKGLVDVIYIDPPYNTGNKDFVYNDKFIDSEDGYRHSKWLSFMEKRLKLAKELLDERGIIFISIDDNEQAELKLLCDNIFGNNNFIANISVVNNLSGRSDKKFIATSHEYLLIYVKDSIKCYFNGLSLNDEQLKKFNFEDSISKYKLESLWKTGKNSRREDRPNLYYPIYYNEQTKHIDIVRNSVDDIEIFPTTDGYEGNWVWGKETFLVRKDTEVVVKQNNKNEWKIYAKFRLQDSDGNFRTVKPKSCWIEPKYASVSGTKELKEILGDKLFNSPKPVDFIKDIINLHKSKNALVLDFFAGSGTTGQAVMELNQEDDGNRQFILCTNNEVSEDKTIQKLIELEKIKTKKEFKLFKDTEEYTEFISSNSYMELGISRQITYKRLSKVINGYRTHKGIYVKGLENNLKYFIVEHDKLDTNTITLQKFIKYASDSLLLKYEGEEEVFNSFEFSIFKTYNNKYLTLLKDVNYIEELLFKLEELNLVQESIQVIIFASSQKDYENSLLELSSKLNNAEYSQLPKELLTLYIRVNI